jgi:hypothetical protein
MDLTTNKHMHPDPSEENQLPPDAALDPDFLREFQGAIKSYAEAITSDQVEEADQAAAAALMMAAAEALAHPTPDLQLAEEAGNFLGAGDWVRSEDAYRKLLTMQEQTGNAGLLAKPQMDLSRLCCLLGRLDEAWAFARAATASARRTEQAWVGNDKLAWAIRVSYWEGGKPANQDKPAGAVLDPAAGRVLWRFKANVIERSATGS